MLDTPANKLVWDCRQAETVEDKGQSENTLSTKHPPTNNRRHGSDRRIGMLHRIPVPVVVIFSLFCLYVGTARRRA